MFLFDASSLKKSYKINRKELEVVLWTVDARLIGLHLCSSELSPVRPSSRAKQVVKLLEISRQQLCAYMIIV